MNFLKTQDIYSILNNCIEYKLPFSHIRFGDGGIKYIYSILFNDLDQLKQICIKEGMPISKSVEFLELWAYYARHADCIDTPEVYFNNTFWPRIKSIKKKINEETEIKMKMWKELYDRVEFYNDTYCNPESNCLFVLDIPGRKNIFDLMKNRKVCIITARPQVKQLLHNFNVTIVPIVGQFRNQYKYSFKNVMRFIKNQSREFDFFLVAAGELGRIYSGYIKECGGRSLDLGFVVDYWLGKRLHPRLIKFINRSCNNPLELKLTKYGMEYLNSI